MQRHWGGIVRISQYRSFCLNWISHRDHKCGVKYWEEILFPHWLLPSPELCVCLLEQMSPLHHLLSSLPWSLAVVEVVITTVILEDMTHLEEDMDPMVAGRVALTRGPDNVSIAKRIIISLRSAERSLIALNGHSRLILTLVLLMLLHPLFGSSGSSTVVLSQDEYGKLC